MSRKGPPVESKDTIDVARHFEAWKGAEMELGGTLGWQVFETVGYVSRGTANFTTPSLWS